jgi:hypothetical protein
MQVRRRVGDRRSTALLDADSLSCHDAHYWEPLFINDLLCWTLNGPNCEFALRDSMTMCSLQDVPRDDNDATFVCNRSGIDGAVKFTVRHNLPTYVRSRGVGHAHCTRP